jgi:hypothetical protein
MLRAKFLDTLRLRLAEIAIGPAALRNQGAPGVIAAARSFLKGLDLRSFVVPEESGFLTNLDGATLSLQQRLPEGTRHWGGARKALNLFLRDALYCTDLAAQFGLQASRNWLEVPLDSYVARGLRGYPHLSGKLPRWIGIKHLTPATNAEYQAAATAVAREEDVARVDLDVIFWRAELLQPAAKV